MTFGASRYRNATAGNGPTVDTAGVFPRIEGSFPAPFAVTCCCWAALDHHFQSRPTVQLPQRLLSSATLRAKAFALTRNIFRLVARRQTKTVLPSSATNETISFRWLQPGWFPNYCQPVHPISPSTSTDLHQRAEPTSLGSIYAFPPCVGQTPSTAPGGVATGTACISPYDFTNDCQRAGRIPSNFGVDMNPTRSSSTTRSFVRSVSRTALSAPSVSARRP